MPVSRLRGHLSTRIGQGRIKAVHVSSDYEMEPDDEFVYVTGGASIIVITLPPIALLVNDIIIVKRTTTGAADVLVFPGGVGETIDGNLFSGLPVDATWERALTLLCDGENWHIVSAFP